MLPTPSIKLGLQAQAQNAAFPTMSDIMESSKAQNLKLHLDTLGPFFRIRAASSSDECLKLGQAKGVVKPWIGGNILRLDSMRATLRLDRSISGLGVFVRAAAVSHSYDNGCRKAELLAINDTEIYHSKLVRFYIRMGFKAVKEIDGSSLGDLPHMVLGGKGTRMDADIEDLMQKWSRRFKSSAAAA